MCEPSIKTMDADDRTTMAPSALSDECPCVCCGKLTIERCPSCEDCGCAECFAWRPCDACGDELCCRCVAVYFRNPAELVCVGCAADCETT